MSVKNRKRAFALIMAIVLCAALLGGCAGGAARGMVQEGANAVEIEIPQPEATDPATLDADTGAVPSERSIVVASVEGIAYIEKENEKVQLRADMALSEGDTVVTEENGYVVLSIDEQKTVHIDGSSTLLLSVVSYSDGNRSTNLLLKDGAMLSHIDEKLPEQEIYEVYTDNIVMGIRGTVASVYYDDDSKTSLVRFLQGSGVVKKTDHSDETAISVWQQTYPDPQGNLVIEGWQIPAQ